MLLHNSRSNLLGLNFELHETTIGEILEKLFSSNSFYKDFNLNYFDFSSNEYRNLQRNITDSLRSKENSFSDYKDLASNLFNEYASNKSKDIKENMHYSFDRAESYDYLTAFETGFIDVELLPNGDWRLLDGFRRLFISTNLTDNVLKYKVLVRIYKELDDLNWINYMYVNNRWKLAYTKNLNELFSRGFSASLYLRNDLSLTSLLDEELKFLNFYGIGSRSFSTNYSYFASNDFNVKRIFMNNSMFISDIKLILELISWFDGKEFKDLKKNGEVKSSYIIDYNGYRYSTSVERFIQMMITTLGNIRHYELDKDLKNKVIKLNDLVGYFEIVDSKSWLKYLNLSVDGHILNNIAGGYFNDYRNYLGEKVGYGSYYKEYLGADGKTVNPNIKLKTDLENINFDDYKL